MRKRTRNHSVCIISEMLFGVRECPLESVIQCYVPNNYTTLYIWKNIWRTNWISTVSNFVSSSSSSSWLLIYDLFQGILRELEGLVCSPGARPHTNTIEFLPKRIWVSHGDHGQSPWALIPYLNLKCNFESVPKTQRSNRLYKATDIVIITAQASSRN